MFADCSQLCYLTGFFEHQDSDDKIIEVGNNIQYTCERTYKEKILKDETQSTDNIKFKEQARLKGEYFGDSTQCTQYKSSLKLVTEGL